jgi:predicted PurR-regulated permease PerM
MALSSRLPSTVTALLTASIVLGILYIAEEVLMPVALAALLSFLLTPPAQWLERHGLNRVFSVLVTALAAFAVLAGLLFVVGNQFLGLVKELPYYKDNLAAKLRPLQSPFGGSLDDTAETIKELSEELNNKKEETRPPRPRIPQVEVVQPPPTPVQVVTNVFGPLLKPLSTAGIIAVFVIFMLLERDSMRDRLLRLSGAQDLGRTTQALDDAMRRITRFLGMQMLINGIQGSLVALALHFIGVPNAMLWGALTIVLRFIPYLGPWMAALMPIALSFAVFEGWTMPLLTIAVLATLELISNNVLEPMLYGHQTGVSPLALLVAAVFWTWLWGLPGLFLAIPLTVSLVVMGKHIPQFRFFSVLLGDEPVLEPRERFYQRLFARDPEDAEEVIEEARRDSTPAAVFDSVLGPAIALAQHDYNRGALEDQQRRYIFSHIHEIAEDLCEAPPNALTDLGPGSLVLCLPAAGEADVLAAAMFARLLRCAGLAARAVPEAAFKGEYAEIIAKLQPACICIAAFPPSASTHASFLCKLVRGRFADIPIVVGLWGARDSLHKFESRFSVAGADRVVDSFSAGTQEIGRLLQPSHQFPAAVTQ